MFRTRSFALYLAVFFAPSSLAFGRTFVVDMQHPSAADANPGTAEQPLKTIGAAAKQVQPGDTVSIKPGLYRETVELDHGGTQEKPIVFEATEPGKVIVTGADRLSGWKKQEGNRPVYWIDWPYEFRVSDGYEGHFHGAAPKALNMGQQVLWQGVPLRPVLEAAQMRPGNFFADWDQHRLYVRLPDGSNPEESPVEACSREYLMTPAYWFALLVHQKCDDVAYITVRGLVFRHASNFAQRGLLIAFSHWQLEDCVFERASGEGLTLHGDGAVVRRCTIQDNGEVGLGGMPTNALIEDCIVRRNNLKGHHCAWEAGGIKLAETDHLRMRRVASYGNAGPGIWLDYNNRDYEVTECICFGNQGITDIDGGSGIFVEVSPGPGRLEKNTCYSNSGSGIVVAECQQVVLENNTLVDNGCGARFRDIKREGWQMQDVVFRHNQIKNWREYALEIRDGDWDKDAATAAARKKLVIENNCYDPPAHKPFLNWSYTPQTSEEAHSKYHICAGDSLRRFQFQPALVKAKPRCVKPFDNIETHLAGAKQGDVVGIPAYGRTAFCKADGDQWTTWVCDLDGGWIQLAVTSKTLGSQMYQRVRSFPGTLPILIRAKVVATTPYVQATVTSVGPAPIDDMAIEASHRDAGGT